MPNSKIVTFGGWSIVAIALLMGIVTAYSSFTFSRFHDRVQQLKDSGELTSLDDLIYEVENELDDARYYLEEIAAMDIDYSVIPRDEDGEIKTDAESIALFKKFAAENQAIFENVKLAINAPDVSVQTTPRPDNFNLVVLSLEEAMEWKANALVAMHNGQGACEVAIDMLMLAKKTEQPFIMEAMQGLAFRSQASQILYDLIEHDLLSSVAPETLAEVFVLLDESNSNETNLLANYSTALNNERTIAIYHLLNSDNLFRDRYGMDQSQLADLSLKLPAGQEIFVGNGFLDVMAEAIIDSKTPLTTKTPDAPSEFNILDIYDAGLSEGFVHIRDQFGGHVAMSRIIRILLALHMADDAVNRDSWPPAYLESIGVPAASTIDPYTAKPMTIKRVNNRWLVYSFAFNHTDDDGDWRHDLRFGGEDIFDKD